MSEMFEIVLYAIYGTLSASAALAIRQLHFAAKHFTPPVRKSGTPLPEHVPSVSVCIPARNETHAMTDCLEHVLASTYPKLEILVLDDSSKDATSTLIKSFAHAGVRFIEGAPLERGWLGKNFALEGLLKQASGHYVLFMDVDTRLAPEAITNMVDYALHEKATILSVMPRREDGWRASVIVSPLRYFWELMFHRHQSPASASSAWMITRDALQEYGGFATVKDSFRPESHLAAYYGHKSKYRFLLSSRDFGVSYEKKWRSQLMTSVRLLYPALDMQWSSMVLVLLDLAIMMSPALLTWWAWSQGLVLHGAISALLALVFLAIYGYYTRRVWAKGWWVAAILWPVVLFQEMILIVVSAVRYRRHSVTWKGRPLQRTEVKS